MRAKKNKIFLDKKIFVYFIVFKSEKELLRKFNSCGGEKIVQKNHTLDGFFEWNSNYKREHPAELGTVYTHEEKNNSQTIVHELGHVYSALFERLREMNEEYCACCLERAFMNWCKLCVTKKKIKK